MLILKEMEGGGYIPQYSQDSDCLRYGSLCSSHRSGLKLQRSVSSGTHAAALTYTRGGDKKRTTPAPLNTALILVYGFVCPCLRAPCTRVISVCVADVQNPSVVSEQWETCMPSELDDPATLVKAKAAERCFQRIRSPPPLPPPPPPGLVLVWVFDRLRLIDSYLPESAPVLTIPR